MNRKSALVHDAVPTRAQELLEGLTDAVLALDQDWVVVYANRAAARLIGRAAGALTGHDFWTVSPSWLGVALQEEYQRALTEHQSIRTEAIEDGGLHRACLTISPAAGGGLLVLVQDCTALEQESAGDHFRSRERARLYQEAQDAIRLRDDFLATAAHDLSGPLATVQGFTQLLRQKASQGPSMPTAQVTAELGRIEQAVDQLAGQVQDLRDLARLQVGRPLTLRPTTLDLVTLAHQCVAEQQRGTRAHRLSVRSTVPAVVGHWDAHRLHRVLTNLLINAIKYSPAGGDITVEVSQEHAGSRRIAVIQVHDPGLGIPAADLPSLFTRAHRGQNVRERLPGTGMGLMSVRQIVEQHGGSVLVESQEGQGSTFTVRLPWPASPPEGHGQ